MSANFLSAALSFKPIAQTVPRIGLPAVSSVFLRGLLLLTCAAAVTAAVWVGDASSFQRSDPSLAQLLRGMAVIKAAIVLGALALLLWRLKWPVARLPAAGYLLSASLMAGSSMLIWQLSFLPLAAALFHIGALMLLLIGWQDVGRLRSGSNQCTSVRATAF